MDKGFSIYDINAAIAIEEMVLEHIGNHPDWRAYVTDCIDSAERASQYRLEALEAIRDKLSG